MLKDGKATNPFMSNDQLAVNKSFATEKAVRQGSLPGQPSNQPPTLFEFKINDNVIQYPDPKKQQYGMDPSKLYETQGIYPSPYVPIPNPFYPNAMNPYYPWSYQTGAMPLIKKYNISISNENGDLTKLHNVFEDVLPQVAGIVQKTLTTLSERSIIYEYLRSIFVRHNDGEDIQFNDTTNGNMNTYKQELVNLLSHIKIMDFNPYHFSRITNNPYSTIPENFVMFRSCYPIRLNGSTNSIQCALDNISLNIRIYEMRVMDLLADKIGHFLEKKDTDLWREIAYYEFIRENILKQKISPNFVMIYAWYLTQKSGVDFVKLRRLKKDKSSNVSAIRDNDIIALKNIKDDITTNIIGTTSKIIEESKKNYATSVIMPDGNMSFDMLMQTSDLDKINIQLPTNKSIVMITEGPTHNLFDWGTKSYVVNSMPIKKMVQTGFHDLKVWQSVMFQILYAMFTMKVHNIAFSEFSIENNIYVKDLVSSRDENIVGYWKYKVNGIEYYVPNYGYLVVIDSKFQEIKNGIENVDLHRIKNLTHKYKIYGSMFNDNDDDINKLNKHNMLNVFNVNNFSVGFSQYGGVKPPKEILYMISEIHNKIDNNHSMTDIFLDTQRHFLNNRLGQLVKDIEKDQIVKDNNSFKPGDIIACTLAGGEGFNPDAYSWGLYIKKNVDSVTHSILTLDTSTMIDNKIPKLIKMNAHDGDICRTFGYVEQTYKANQKLSEDDILETYYLSDN
jgi:hypothetical protein